MSFKHQALTLGAALAALLVTTAGAYAASAFATSPLNVRTGPGTSYRVIDTLRRGERVEIEHCRGSWCAVSKRGVDGWVSANYLSRGGDRYRDRRDFYDDDFFDRPRVIRRFPDRVYRRHGPDFSACFGGANARFCIYD